MFERFHVNYFLLYILAVNILFLIFPHSALLFLLFLFSFYVLYRIKINKKLKIAIAVTSLCLVIPLAGIQNTYYLDVIIQAGIYAALAIGLNIVVGFAGLLDLGYIAFYAVGAYIYAILATSQASNFISFISFPLSGMWFWPILFVGMLFAAVLGVILGFPALRLRGDYLAIVTLGFGEIVRIILNNLDKPINITNGPKGISPIAPPSFFGIELSNPIYFYFIVLVFIIFTVIVTNRLKFSKIGRAWAAIREDELAASGSGVPILKMKLLAFALGASFAGSMGVIFAAKQSFIDPTSFGFMESIGILSMVILGGLGSVAGAITGAVAVVVLQLQVLKELSEFISQLSISGILVIPSQLDPAKFERLIFGLILILMCIFRPKGFIPAKRRLYKIEK